MMDEIYLEMYKVYYKDIIITHDNNIMLQEFKKLNKNKDNNFIELFEKYTRKPFDKYKEESLNKEYLGNAIKKFFEGEELTENEISKIALSSVKEKINSYELISFKNLRKRKGNNLDNFIYNTVDIEELKKSMSFGSFFKKDSYITDFYNLGNIMFKYYNGEELTENEMIEIVKSDDYDKVNAMIFVAPAFFNLNKKKEKKEVFLDNEEKIDNLKPKPVKIKRKVYPF